MIIRVESNEMCRGGEKKAHKVHHRPSHNGLYTLSVNLERARIPRLSLVARLRYDICNVTYIIRDEQSGHESRGKKR
jgi:hypothetical protein